MSNTTVVTAFYKFGKSKHTLGEYLSWIKNFFESVTSPIVCFCENTRLLKVLQAKHTVVTYIETPMVGSFDLTTPEWMEKWRKQQEIDPEADIHSPELYIVWALKQEFVQKAIQRNLYGSTHFVWCDIGCFRSPENLETPLRFAEATPSVTIRDKITILNILDRYIGGTILAGNITSWSLFTERYLQALKDLEEKGLFYGKDQDVYVHMWKKNPELFHVVKAEVWGKKKYDNGKVDTRWFYLTKYLSGQ
jgi:hypothetical protein